MSTEPVTIRIDDDPQPQIYSLLANIADMIGAITKDKRNTQGSGFMYRGIDDVMNALHPLLAKFGVTIIPNVLDYTREERVTGKGTNLLYTIMKVRYTFYAPDGSNVSCTVIGEAMDSGDKASNKAMSVAYKYACFQTFCIPTEEMIDPDSETHEPSVPKSYDCVNCGKPFEGFTSKDGKTFTGPQVYHMSENKYGRALCPDCVKATNAQPIKRG